MKNDRFDRQVRFFGKEGQQTLAKARVAIVGVGGLGSHVAQQLALLGVGGINTIDSEDLSETDCNRLAGVRDNDPIPGTRKVDIAERTIKSIDPTIKVRKIYDSLVTDDGFSAIIQSDYTFGCLDSEGARLILNELCSAYAKPYFDLASDVIPGDPPDYGGQVCIAWSGEGCLSCLNILDRVEAEAELAGPEARRRRNEQYGLAPELLDEVGPSVVSINGVIASLGVTEFMLAATGMRLPNRLLTYRGRFGRVGVSADLPAPGCYYCKEVRGKRDVADVQRYIREGVGSYLR